MLPGVKHSIFTMCEAPEWAHSKNYARVSYTSHINSKKNRPWWEPGRQLTDFSWLVCGRSSSPYCAARSCCFRGQCDFFLFYAGVSYKLFPVSYKMSNRRRVLKSNSAQALSHIKTHGFFFVSYKLTAHATVWRFSAQDPGLATIGVRACYIYIYIYITIR